MNASLLSSESALLSAAVALGARRVAGWSSSEEALVRSIAPPDPVSICTLRERIRRGEDPLGQALQRLRSAEMRRSLGATYTPRALVRSMLRWASSQAPPVRIVEPGAGTGRFLVEAGRRFAASQLVGVEVDPTAALLARGNLAAAGFADRSEIRVEDYCTTEFASASGPTLFIANPPYVRHHEIDLERKRWLLQTARSIGLEASGLSGLHVYFFLATALQARAGDYGVFVTASEWLDTNYGALLRSLFLGPLGGESLTILTPETRAFEGTATTATIMTFCVGSAPRTIRVREVSSLARLDRRGGDRASPRERLARETRWSRLTKAARTKPVGLVELGELCRVHRGQVTGANRVFIVESDSRRLPAEVRFPAITHARELFRAGANLVSAAGLRQVVDLPEDLDSLGDQERVVVDAFLADARIRGADRSYVASHRRVWWRVGLRDPAPILASYMARRPPAFVRNLAGVWHVNIAHGLYPRQPLAEAALEGLVKFLTAETRTEDGRTYAGGLTKFEPREMERLWVPDPTALVELYEWDAHGSVI